MSDNITAKMAGAWLRRAAELIEGGRQEDYGDFMTNSIYVAERAGLEWEKNEGILQAIDVMIGYKKARLNHSPTHEDSIVDLIGYAALREAVRVRLLDE